MWVGVRRYVDRSPVPRSTLVAAAMFIGFSFIVLAVGVGDDDYLPVGRRVLGSLSLAALYAAPGVLGLLATRGRPALLAAGGVLGLVLIPTSMSITPLLVVPSVMMVVAWGPVAPSPVASPRLPTVVTVAFTAALGAIAFLIGIAGGDDAVCWSWTEDAAGHRVYHLEPVGPWAANSAGGSLTGVPGTSAGGGCTSDTITTAEAWGRLGLTVLLMGTAYVSAGPASRSPATVTAG